MMEDLFHLTWNNYNRTVIQNLQRLRLKQIFCDATIVCEGNYFLVHRVVLSSCSAYFQEIFEKTPCQHPFIVMKDIEVIDLSAILDFMYEGEVNILQSRLSFFIRAGENLKIKGLFISFNDENKESVKASQNYDYLSSSISTKAASNFKTDKKLIPEIDTKCLDVLSHESTEDEQSSELSLVFDGNETSVPSAIKQPEKPPSFSIDETEETTKVTSKGPESCVQDIEEIKESRPTEVKLGESQANSSTSPVHPSKSNSSNTSYGLNLEEITSFLSSVKVENEELYNPMFLNTLSSESTVKNSESASLINNSASCSSATHKDSSLRLSPEVLESMNFTNQEIGVHFMSEISSSENKTPKFRRKNSPLFKCPICSYQAVYRSQHLNHLRIHTGEKPFKCKVCPFRTSDSSTLRVHKRTHTGEKPYQCSICSKCFAKKSNLKTHLRIHTGEKPHKCEFCPFSTNDSSTLRRHRLRHSRIFAPSPASSIHS